MPSCDRIVDTQSVQGYGTVMVVVAGGRSTRPHAEFGRVWCVSVQGRTRKFSIFMVIRSMSNYKFAIQFCFWEN